MDNWNSNHENEYTGMTAQRRNRRRSEPANGQIEGQIGMRLDPVASDEEDRIEALVETNVPGVFSMPKEPDAAKEPEEPKKAAEAGNTREGGGTQGGGRDRSAGRTGGSGCGQPGAAGSAPHGCGSLRCSPGGCEAPRNTAADSPETASDAGTAPVRTPAASGSAVEPRDIHGKYHAHCGGSRNA